MVQVERVWHRRLRWRLRGAWQWPAFLVLTLVDGILLTVLPPYEGGPPAVYPGVLLAATANLLAIAVVAPLAGRLLRRRRPDLPRPVASDYAGAWLLAGITGVIVVAGVAHRSAAAAETEREHLVARAMHDYVVAQAPEYARALDHIDAVRLEADRYRACVPGRDERHALCLFVTTDQDPPGITRDTSEEPNSVFRRAAGG
jgi:4-amino-4-deoxy-L-arabinose transferase-like glycosyltransferase